MTFYELLAKNPGPWTCDAVPIIRDLHGDVVREGGCRELTEAVNRIGELQRERDEIRRERDGFKGMLAPKVCSYGGDDTEYFDGVVAKHPLPWTGSIDGMIRDSSGGGFAIFCSEFMRLFLPAINSIVSLRAERDSLQSKVEELESTLMHVKTESARVKWNENCGDSPTRSELLLQVEELKRIRSALREERDSLLVKVEELTKERDDAFSCARDMDGASALEAAEALRDQRRFEAACAFGASHYARGMFSADPDAIATFAVKYADALLAASKSIIQEKLLKRKDPPHDRRTRLRRTVAL